MFHGKLPAVSFAWLLCIAAASGCSDCYTDVAVAASLTCPKVFDGKYKACHGPGWTQGSHDYCAKPDYYLLSVQRVHPSGGFEVVHEVKLPPDQVKTGGWRFRNVVLFESEMVVDANEQTGAICYRGTDPPTCFATR